MRSSATILCVASFSWLLAATAAAAQCDTRFTLINGSLCIRSQFVETVNNMTSEQQCAIMCGLRLQCQAFSLSDGPCQLFVFNKCSKLVRDCGCTRRGRVFVRQQPGLPPGLLCPVGYGDDWCGVKYMVFNTTDRSWITSRQKCDNESGLVIMADVTSSTEMDHVESIWSMRANGSSMWLGGFQAPGSSSPSDGWVWVGCNIPVNSSFWASGEPNDSGDNIENAQEDAIGRYSGLQKLNDLPKVVDGVSKLLCECVSPFE